MRLFLNPFKIILKQNTYDVAAMKGEMGIWIKIDCHAMSKPEDLSSCE